MTQKPRRRWFQFSLRSLLIVMLVLSVGFGLYLPARRRSLEQWEAANALRSIAVSMTDDNGNDWMLKKKREMSPTWQRWLGIDCPTCTKVAILSSQQNDAAIRNHLMKLPQLESIILNVFWLDDKFLEALSKLPKLQKLEVTSGSITDDGILHFAGKQSLRSLYFNGSHLSDRGLATVASLPNLTSLEWATEHTSDCGISHLRGNSRLTNVSLRGHEISDEGLKYLSTCENLEDLAIWASADEGEGVTEKGIRLLTRLKKLKRLSLRSSYPPDSIAALSTLTTLEELRLQGPVLDEEFIATLAPLTSLKIVSIKDAKLTGVGLRGLSNLKQLEQLNISLAGLGDEDMELLSSFPKLWSLDLRNSAVTDAGLMKLVGLKKLRWLDVRDSKITYEAIDDFKDLVPGVDVVGGVLEGE